MSRTKKMLITMVIAMYSISLLLMTRVSANNSQLNSLKNGNSNSSTVKVSYNNLISRNDLFCIQHNARFRSADGEVTYAVKGHITIVGNSIGNYTNTANGTFAYILNRAISLGGYGTSTSYTAGQVALYRYYSTWYNKLKSSGYNMNKIIAPASSNNKVTLTSSASKIIEDGKEYAKNLGQTKATVEDNTDKSSIKVMKTAIDGKEYLRVGPFNWKYTGAINNLNVYDGSNNQINDVKYSKFVGQDEVIISKSEIKSEKNFYIILNVESISYDSISKIEATFKENGGKVYKADVWFLSNNREQNLLLAKVNEENTNDNVSNTFDYDIKLTKDITIIKVDSRDQNIKLKNVGFKIQNKETKEWLKQVGNEIQFVSSMDQATEFKTDVEGQIKIENLTIGTYLAYETSNPNYGYEVLEGSIEIAQKEEKVTITNKQKYVKLSGYVWVDGVPGKETKGNNLYKNDVYDNNDVSYDNSTKNNMVVNLKNNNGDIIKTAITGEYDIYDEIDGGEYLFEDVLIDELDNYYIEFEYNGFIYQSVPVNITVSNGSKAEDAVERELLNKKFTSIDSTGTNTINVDDISIIYNETKDHITSIKDSTQCFLHANTKDADYKIKFTAGTEEIKYINLGLYVRPQADLGLGQDLAAVNVGVNGYWHVYKYGSKNYETSDSWNVGVRFTDGLTYKRAIYKSDIEYETEDKSKELQVYLTYKIVLNNKSGCGYAARVNSIVDYFDSRYQLVGAGTGIDSNYNIIEKLNVSNPISYGDGKYQKMIIDSNVELNDGEQKNIYVQFKLNREAVITIMNNNETLYTTAEINSYTLFENGKTVAAVDRNSVPGNAIPGNIDTYEDDTESAPPVKLEISNNAREITGTVFVDATREELESGKERIGNGIFENGETTIKGVTVTLHEENNSIPDMITTTKENGEFEFNSYIPGKYTITYTWGDETYNVKEYKATIYVNPDRQTRIDVQKNPWYKDITPDYPRYSDAIDNYETRTKIDYEKENITKMDSKTPIMEFSVEYDTNITDGTDDKVEFIVKEIDFGIVERPRQQLDIDKRVGSFKITLANGQVIVDAKVEETVDENGNVQRKLVAEKYVTYMGPSTLNGFTTPGFIKAEIDTELLDGATMEVTYLMKIINNSELDYMTQEYYNYGENKINVVTLKPSVVTDYLDKNLSYVTDKNPEWNEISVENLTSSKKEDLEFINKRLVLETNKAAVELKPGESTSIDLYVSKVLASSNDMTFNNDVEVTKIERPNVPNQDQHRGSIIKYVPYDEAEEVEITPSTGANQNYILPVIIGVTALITLGVGIVIIRKRIMDSK